MYEKEDAPTERVKLLTLLSGEEDFELSRFVSSYILPPFTPSFNLGLPLLSYVKPGEIVQYEYSMLHPVKG